MVISAIEFTLKDGRKAIIRSPQDEDAVPTLEYLHTASGETDFLLSYPEEIEKYSPEGEKQFFHSVNSSSDNVMLMCFVEGRLAGNCSLSRYGNIKTRHRADAAIALTKEFWGLGIGTRLFEELINIARNMGIEQLELDCVEGNSRAMGLYEKLGFKTVCVLPNAFHLKNGTPLSRYTMVKVL